MKKTAFFLITILIFASARIGLSQNVPVGFFMPQSELQPRYEKLPPVPTPQPKLPSARAAYEQRRNQQNQAANINSTANIQHPVSRKVKEYIAVDGRFIPIYETESISAATSMPTPPETPPEATQIQNTESVDETTQSTEYTTNKSADNPAKTVLDTNLENETLHQIPDVEATHDSTSPDDKDNLPQPPQVTDIDPELPSYRKRYGQYINNLQIFHQTGQMPFDPELDSALNKLSSNKKRTLFEGTIK